MPAASRDLDSVRLPNGGQTSQRVERDDHCNGGGGGGDGGGYLATAGARLTRGSRECQFNNLLYLKGKVLW